MGGERRQRKERGGGKDQGKETGEGGRRGEGERGKKVEDDSIYLSLELFASDRVTLLNGCHEGVLLL